MKAKTSDPGPFAHEAATASSEATMRRGGSLRGAGPRGSGDFLKASGFADMPRHESGASTMRPGALRGSARGRDLDSLAHTLFLRIYPVIAVVVLVTQIGIAWVNYSDQIRLYTERTDLLAAFTAKAIARPDWSASPEIYRQQVQALTLDPAFRAAALRDATGAVVMSLGDMPRRRVFDLITSQSELMVGANPQGRLTLAISAEDLRGNAERQAILALVTSLILMLAFVVTLHANVRRHVLAPLQRLLVAMREVEHKRWVPVNLNGEFRASNEIDVISQAFNRMVDGLRTGDEAKQLLQQLEQTHAKLEDANRQVMESIGYARRIQSSVLPERSALDGAGLEVAVLWEPLHLVGGDYFWLEEIDGLGIVVVADCTGHGVPGAFLTLIVATALDRILHERGLRSPTAILAALDDMVRAQLRQDGRGSESDDGLDCGVCVWDPAKAEIRFAGAGMALTAITDGAATRIKGGRRGLGYPRRAGGHFTTEDVAVLFAPGTAFYLMTDGISDQMGGQKPLRRLLGHRGVTEILGAHSAEPLTAQVAALETALAEYRNGESRRDDMTLVAFRPTQQAA